MCLDHCHRTGHIRMVLCRNCNGLEGEIFNRCRRGKRSMSEQWFLKRILQYWELTEGKNLHGLYHPDHKTEEEKRIERNRKARLARAKRKAKENLK